MEDTLAVQPPDVSYPQRRLRHRVLMLDKRNIAGIAVSIGARIASVAAPGQVLASSTVKDLVAGSGLLFEDRGGRRLKGIADEWRLFAVAG